MFARLPVSPLFFHPRLYPPPLPPPPVVRKYIHARCRSAIINSIAEPMCDRFRAMFAYTPSTCSRPRHHSPAMPTSCSYYCCAISRGLLCACICYALCTPALCCAYTDTADSTMLIEATRTTATATATTSTHGVHRILHIIFERHRRKHELEPVDPKFVIL